MLCKIKAGKNKNGNYNPRSYVVAWQLRFDRNRGAGGIAGSLRRQLRVALQPSLIQKLTCQKMGRRSDTLPANVAQAWRRELQENAEDIGANLLQVDRRGETIVNHFSVTQ